jgi:MYXO-CTERM domain-containing protein
MSAVASSFQSAWYRLEVWVGAGNGPYAVGAAVVLLLVLLFWRRR